MSEKGKGIIVIVSHLNTWLELGTIPTLSNLPNAEKFTQPTRHMDIDNYIFRENSRKVDDHFSLFFVKNFTETKESLFGYFFVKIWCTTIIIACHL